MRNALLTALEVVFVLMVVAGVALWSPPAALVLAGTCGVVAVERATTRRPLPKEAPR